MKMEQSGPKRRHTKFRSRGITQKKEYKKKYDQIMMTVIWWWGKCNSEVRHYRMPVKTKTQSSFIIRPQSVGHEICICCAVLHNTCHTVTAHDTQTLFAFVLFYSRPVHEGFVVGIVLLGSVWAISGYLSFPLTISFLANYCPAQKLTASQTGLCMELRGRTIHFVNSPPCACLGSTGLMTLTNQRFTAVLLLIYGSLFLSGIY